MAITDWPADERPREKLLHLGAAALSDAELLAIFLRTGIKGRTAVDLARDLLLQHGGISALLSASQREFCRTPGLGEAKYTQLQATIELARRHLAEELVQRDLLQSPADTFNYLQAQLCDHPQEVFACLFLDSRHRVIRFEKLFRGTIDGAAVYPREVARRALELNAAAIIVAHNHPSGVAEPSRADIAITASLKSALSQIEIRLLDHIVVGRGEMTSMAEQGLL